MLLCRKPLFRTCRTFTLSLPPIYWFKAKTQFLVTNGILMCLHILLIDINDKAYGTDYLKVYAGVQYYAEKTGSRRSCVGSHSFGGAGRLPPHYTHPSSK